MNKIWVGIAAIAVVAGCETTAPLSNAGPGFSDYTEYAQNRDAVLTGQQALGVDAVGTTTLGANTTTSSSGDADGDGQVDVVQQSRAQDDANLRSGEVEASPGNSAPVLIGSTFSDEQSFAAVSARETIESDAERRAALAAQYQVSQVNGLPSRPNAGPNIVEYALTAPNAKGQEWYSRFVLSGQGRFERNCASYNNPDDAQRDFLSRGGPEKDPRGIDPDGDGFACGWDPAPFIAAFRANQ